MRGEHPEPPEGFGGRDDGGRGGFNMEASERSTTFTITEGANFFISVAAA